MFRMYKRIRHPSHRVNNFHTTYVKKCMKSLISSTPSCSVVFAKSFDLFQYQPTILVSPTYCLWFVVQNNLTNWSCSVSRIRKKYKIPLPETIFESSSRYLGSSFGHLIFQHHQTRNIILWNPLSKNQISLPTMLFEIKKVTLSSKSTKEGVISLQFVLIEIIYILVNQRIKTGQKYRMHFWILMKFFTTTIDFLLVT